MTKTEFEVEVNVYTHYSSKEKSFTATIETLHHDIDEKIQTLYAEKNTTVKQAVFNFSKECLQEYNMLVNSYKYRKIVMTIHYTNNKVFRMFMDEQNGWIDQLKNSLRYNYSLLFRKEGRNIAA